MSFRHIDRVAEQHFFLRRQLESALDGFKFLPGNSDVVDDCITYKEYWRESYSDRFFDMSTLVRIGSAAEHVLKDAYVQKMGYQSRQALVDDPLYSVGVFQRTNPPRVEHLYKMFRRFGVELNQFAEWIVIQELMLDRHLYAHALGLLDERHILQVRVLTGVDLMSDARIAGTFPEKDLYWFQPLVRIPEYIEAVRHLDRWLKSD